MRNILLAAALLLVSFFLAPKAAAVVSKTGSSVVVPVPVVTMQKVQYTLPYPGILPDNPLYFLKQLRDKILDILIVDPIRKIEFYILQADKRLAMGMMLTSSGKNALAETTISKGEKYLSQAITALTTLRASGKPIPGSVLDQLEKSLLKHVEVLKELIAKATEAQRAGLLASLELVKKLQADLAKLK